MAQAKQKFYVVWEGNKPGIYHSWADCQAQIKGYPNARYKAFGSKAEAEEAYANSPFDYFAKGKKAKPKRSVAAKENIVWESWAVDAACSGNPGDLEYRGVETKSGNEIFKVGPFKMGTNNIGEFLAIVHALALLKRAGKENLPIYSDSRTAISWVKKKQVRTNLAKTRLNSGLFDLIDRGISWLNNNTYRNPLLKWETKDWGEIPADFGRK